MNIWEIIKLEYFQTLYIQLFYVSKGDDSITVNFYITTP